MYISSNKSTLPARDATLTGVVSKVPGIGSCDSHTSSPTLVFPTVANAFFLAAGTGRADGAALFSVFLTLVVEVVDAALLWLHVRTPAMIELPPAVPVALPSLLGGFCALLSWSNSALWAARGLSGTLFSTGSTAFGFGMPEVLAFPLAFLGGMLLILLMILSCCITRVVDNRMYFDTQKIVRVVRYRSRAHE